MFTSITGQDSSVSHHLQATKEVLQDAVLNADIANTTADKAEVDDLERDALEILRLIRSLRNRLAPISRIPPEVLTLIPDFLYNGFPDEDRDQDCDVITLTHICRAWREMFISRSSLWSRLDCVHAEKAHAYFERSGSSLINLRLWGGANQSTLDTFLQIIPQAIGRLKSLLIFADPEILQAVMPHLPHPAPFLEKLDLLCGDYEEPRVRSTIFDGDLSSLRELRLEHVRTELPWRNMINLTSFTLGYIPVGDFGQLLDFFESAPRLRDIELLYAILVSYGGNKRLVSLDHLEKLVIIDCGPTSTFLDQLVIPAGARLVIQIGRGAFKIKDHIPRSLNNLKNLSSITKICLRLDVSLSPSLRLNGPDGELYIVISHIGTLLVFESLALFDTSKTERLRINSCSGPLYRESPYRALLAMKNLRTLALSRFTDLSCAFMDILNPNTSPSKEVVCPSLEELVFVRPRGSFDGDGEKFDMRAVIEMVAARAARGVKLGTVRDQAKLDPADVLELRKHVSHVECGHKVALYEDGSDSGDWEE